MPARTTQGWNWRKPPIASKPLVSIAIVFFVAQGFRACGRDQRALRSPFGNLRTASKFVELYRSFSERNTRKSYGEVTSSIARKGGKGQRPLVSPNKHAEEVRRSHLLNREKGSPEGRRPFGGVKGQRPLWGLGQRPNCSSSDQFQGSRQQKRRQRSVPASNFALPQERPQAALPSTCTLSRQMGATT